MARPQKTVAVPGNALPDGLPALVAQGVTELSVHDRALAGNKKALLSLLSSLSRDAPDLFVSLLVEPRCVDAAFVQALDGAYCSLELELRGTEREGILVLDKKAYAAPAALLNRAGAVFGFFLSWGMQDGDSFRAFRERLDFAVTLWPNHLDFAQLEPSSGLGSARATGTFSTQDLQQAARMAFACKTFYSCGRAVPWFQAVLRPLRISPSAFFADFAEWQRCNNCAQGTGFLPDDVPHADVQKMQLVFLQQKYEEKRREALFAAVRDLICLHGAFSRVVAEGEESVVETSYHPDEVLSLGDVARFVDAVPMEPVRVRVSAEHGEIACTVLGPCALPG